MAADTSKPQLPNELTERILDLLLEDMALEVDPSRLRVIDGQGVVHFELLPRDSEQELPVAGRKCEDITRAGLVWSPEARAHPARVWRQVCKAFALQAEVHIWEHVWLLSDHHNMLQILQHLQSTYEDLSAKLSSWTTSFVYAHWHTHGLRQATSCYRYLRLWHTDSLLSAGITSSFRWLHSQLVQAVGWGYEDRDCEEQDKDPGRWLVLCSPLLHDGRDTYMHRLLAAMQPAVNISLDFSRESYDRNLTSVFDSLDQKCHTQVTILGPDVAPASADYVYWETWYLKGLAAASRFVTNNPTLVFNHLDEETLAALDLAVVDTAWTRKHAWALQNGWLAIRPALTRLYKRIGSWLEGRRPLEGEDVLEALNIRCPGKYGKGYLLTGPVRTICATKRVSGKAFVHVGQLEADNIANAFNKRLPAKLKLWSPEKKSNEAFEGEGDEDASSECESETDSDSDSGQVLTTLKRKRVKLGE